MSMGRRLLYYSVTGCFVLWFSSHISLPHLMTLDELPKTPCICCSFSRSLIFFITLCVYLIILVLAYKCNTFLYLSIDMKPTYRILFLIALLALILLKFFCLLILVYFVSLFDCHCIGLCEMFGDSWLNTYLYNSECPLNSLVHVCAFWWRWAGGGGGCSWDVPCIPW